jgi:hypothetical protein
MYICSISLIEYHKSFRHLLIYRAHSRFCSLDDQRVRTRVATLCSARYFLTNLRSTDALSNRIFVRAVTSYSHPDSPTIWWTSNSRSPRGSSFSAAFEGREEDRDRFEDGEPSPSVPPSSSAKTSKNQSPSRLSGWPDPLRLRLRLPEGLAMESPYING